MGVEGGSVDAEQSGDCGDRFFAQFGCHADLVWGHHGGPAQPLASGAGGVETFGRAFHDEFRMTARAANTAHCLGSYAQGQFA